MGHPKGYRLDYSALERRRLQGVKLLEQGLSQAEVARRMDVSRQTISVWEKKRHQGRAALKWNGRVGRPSRISDEQKTELRLLLERGAKAAGYQVDLWTLPRVSAVIKKRFGISYNPGHVWRLLRALGFSCQRPTYRAVERNEEEIRRWKRRTWPGIKKKP
jgi:transposase